MTTIKVNDIDLGQVQNHSTFSHHCVIRLGASADSTSVVCAVPAVVVRRGAASRDVRHIACMSIPRPGTAWSITNVIAVVCKDARMVISDAFSLAISELRHEFVFWAGR